MTFLSPEIALDLDLPEVTHERRVAHVTSLVTEDPKRLVVIVGPTASGKTALAVDVCARVNGEVVSADSIQVYRGFDLGSGKPSLEEKAKAAHHLVDICDAHAPIDAVQFAELADAVMADIRSRGKVPILCGGTFFWIRALVMGLAPAPRASESVRTAHRAIVAAHGRAALHDELAKVDAAAALRLHPNDTVRVSRALEVHALSGRTMTEHHEEHGFRSWRLPATLVGLHATSEALTARIERRVDAWLARGWVDEVRELIARGYGETRAMASVGYAEVSAHVKGQLSEPNLRDAIVRSTRVFARKQRTWLKSANILWL